MARCPYSPQHNSTALLTASGELYAATAMDFPGRDPAIYRSLGLLPPLRTAQYNSKWLNGKPFSHRQFPSHWSVMPGYFSAPKQTVILVKENFLHFLEKSRCNLFCTSKRKGIRCGTKDTKCRFGHSLLAYLFLKRKISSIS